MKKIAVLIPSYKPEGYLKNCLLSLEEQTISKKMFSVYIALNGPKESYENYIFTVLKEMSFNFKYLYIEQPGVSNARNQLINISNEEFIVFIDDDDIISENYLENLLKVSNKKILGITNIFNFEKNLNELKENYIGKTFTKINKKEPLKFKTRKYFSSPWAKMIHRSMINDIRFDTTLSKGEDSLFMTYISKNIEGVQKTTNNTFYYVYERVGSVTRQKVSLKQELKTITYLSNQYLKLLFNKDYKKIFILTRLLATVLKLKSLYK